MLRMTHTACLPMHAKEIPESEFGPPTKLFFRRDNLRASSFRETNLIGANFGDSNLRGANFRYCFAPGVQFNAAHLKGASFKGQTFDSPLLTVPICEIQI